MDLGKIKQWIIRKYDKEPRFKLVVDVSPCNLKCAMCPRGGISGLKNESRELMDFELFKRIVDKFLKEKVKIKYIEIGDWGEPLLNPALLKMISYAKDKLRPKFLSQETSIDINTNLNYLKNPTELLESGADVIRISISGMTQEIYSKNHRGGNIELVLSNILKLVNIKNERKIKNVTFYMRFHDLIYNKRDAELARKFCEDHGLIFTYLKVYIPTVEECIKFHQEKEKLTKYYTEFIDLTRETNLMRTLNDIEDCWLQRNFVVINPAGQLYRCCAVFDQRYFMGSFFDFKIRDIPNIKSDICKKCIKTPISFR